MRDLRDLPGAVSDGCHSNRKFDPAFKLDLAASFHYIQLTAISSSILIAAGIVLGKSTKAFLSPELIFLSLQLLYSAEYLMMEGKG